MTIVHRNFYEWTLIFLETKTSAVFFFLQKNIWKSNTVMFMNFIPEFLTTVV